MLVLIFNARMGILTILKLADWFLFVFNVNLVKKILPARHNINQKNFLKVKMKNNFNMFRQYLLFK